MNKIRDDLSPPPELVARKGVTKRKVNSTVKRVKAFCRYVFLFKSDGTTNFIYNKNGYIANVISVIGPAFVEGEMLSETLILEIGISRGRPYSGAERNIDGKNYQLHKRSRVREITKEEFIFLWPHLAKVFASATAQVRVGWKTKGEWWVIAEGVLQPFERGIYFSVSREDKLAFQQVYVEDNRLRLKYLSRRAWLISWWLRGCKFAYYPPKQLRSIPGVQKCIDLWKRMNLSPRLGRLVIGSIGKRIPKLLFIEALREFKLSDPFDEEREKLKPLKIPPLSDGNLRIVRENGEIHGRNCVIFEFYFKKEVRERLGV